MFKTLYAKLATVLIGLFGLIGIGYLLLTVNTTRLYFQELTQQFNRTLAKDLISGEPLIQNGHVDQSAIKHIFHVYMDINPKIEVYLLDWQGNIMTYSAPAEKVKRTRVSLEPILHLLNETNPLPIFGDDPRNQNRQKVFSATRIGPAEKPEGYLYVVLEGEKFDSVVHLLESSYILRLSTWTIIGIMVFGLMAGLVLFNFLTARITILSVTMKAFQDNGLESIPPSPRLDTRSNDEIGQLGASFKHMARKIVEQMKDLKRTDTLRRELVANVSHDLRTPLASLQGYLETLQLKDSSLSTVDRAQYLEIAMKHSEKLTTLVTELFELAKLDSRETQLQAEPFSVAELGQDILIKSQLLAERAGINLEGHIPHSLPFVLGDIALIERVLENLLHNAVQYTPPGGTVSLSLIQTPDFVITHVTDTGSGIPPSDVEHIFDRFYQAKRTGPSQSSGAGLGLAIAKRILELHNQTITVKSQIDRGTTFTFSLPIHLP